MSNIVVLLFIVSLVSCATAGGEKKKADHENAVTTKETKDLERDETSRLGRPSTYGVERWSSSSKGWPSSGYGGSSGSGGYGGQRQDHRDYRGWGNDYGNRKGWSSGHSGGYPSSGRPGWNNYPDQNRDWYSGHGDDWRRNRGGWQQFPGHGGYMNPMSHQGNRWRGDRGYAFKGSSGGGYGNYGSYGTGIYGNQVYGSDHHWGNQGNQKGWGSSSSSYGGGGGGGGGSWDPRRYGRGHTGSQPGYYNQNQYGNMWGQRRQGNYKGSSGYGTGDYGSHWQQGGSGSYGSSKGFQGSHW